MSGVPVAAGAPGNAALSHTDEAKPDDIDCATNARRVLSHILGQEIKKPAMAAGDVKLLKTSRRRIAKAG